MKASVRLSAAQIQSLSNGERITINLREGTKTLEVTSEPRKKDLIEELLAGGRRFK